MQLADLVVALRSVELARNGGISCSIEPTIEGRDRLRNFLRNVKLARNQNPKMFEGRMKEAFGPANDSYRRRRRRHAIRTNAGGR